MAGITGITYDQVRTETLTDSEVSPTASINEHKIAMDLIVGHNHNGINSRMITGGGGGSAPITDGIFTGPVDGFNMIFTMGYDFVPNTVAVYIDGIRNKRGLHFTELAPNQIELVAPPKNGATLVFDYIPA